jgi:hypothetical protein
VVASGSYRQLWMQRDRKAEHSIAVIGPSSRGYCWRIRRPNSYSPMGRRDTKAERLVLAKGRSVSQASMRMMLMARAVLGADNVEL